MVGVDLDVSELLRLEAENLQMRLNQQKQLIQAVLTAQEEEKDRIAESLHNSLAQMLFAVRIRLDAIPVASSGQELKTDALTLLYRAIEQTRELSHELTPRLLTEYGLEEAVSEFCANLSSEELLIRCQVKLSQPLENHLQVALYRISQELVNNIVKHARASIAILKITQANGEVMLEVRDNGQGFDVRREGIKGIGLASIRSRVDLLGGTLEVNSTLEQGTVVGIRLPEA